MVVIVIDNAAESLRGELCRWLLETKPGVFVGNLNAMVRQKLWDKVVKGAQQGALLLYSASNEQGFSVEMTGQPRRSIIDLDGLKLIKIQ